MASGPAADAALPAGTSAGSALATVAPHSPWIMAVKPRSMIFPFKKGAGELQTRPYHYATIAITQRKWSPGTPLPLHPRISIIFVPGPGEEGHRQSRHPHGILHPGSLGHSGIHRVFDGVRLLATVPFLLHRQYP